MACQDGMSGLILNSQCLGQLSQMPTTYWCFRSGMDGNGGMELSLITIMDHSLIPYVKQKDAKMEQWLMKNENAWTYDLLRKCTPWFWKVLLTTCNRVQCGADLHFASQLTSVWGCLAKLQHLMLPVGKGMRASWSLQNQQSANQKSDVCCFKYILSSSDPHLDTPDIVSDIFWHMITIWKYVYIACRYAFLPFFLASVLTFIQAFSLAWLRAQARSQESHLSQNLGTFTWQGKLQCGTSTFWGPIWTFLCQQKLHMETSGSNTGTLILDRSVLSIRLFRDGLGISSRHEHINLCLIRGVSKKL